MKKRNISLYLELRDVNVGLHAYAPNNSRDFRIHAIELIDNDVERNAIDTEKAEFLKKLAEDEWSDSSFSWNISGVGHMQRYISMAIGDENSQKLFSEIEVHLGSALSPPTDKIEGSLKFIREEWEDRQRMPDDRPFILFSISKSLIKRLCHEILSKQITGISMEIRAIDVMEKVNAGFHGPTESTDFIYIDGNECQVTLESITLSKKVNWINNVEDKRNPVITSDEKEVCQDAIQSIFEALITKQTEMIDQTKNELKALKTVGIWIFGVLITLMVLILFK